MLQKIFYLIITILVFDLNLNCADSKKDNLYQMTLPEFDWSLDIDLTNFEISENKFDEEMTSSMILATDKINNITLSIYLEPAAKFGDNKICRDYYFDRTLKSPGDKTDIKKSELGDMAIGEYLMPEFKGQKVNSKNINAYISYKNYWIDIHLSKILFVESDITEMYNILKSVKINKNFTPSNLLIFATGSQFYLRQNYKKAIVQYEKVLLNEKAKPELEHDFWRVLIDNLGMSYGIPVIFPNQ